MGSSLLIVALVAANGAGTVLPQSEIKKQNEIFQGHWGTDLVWKFDDLPAKAVVPAHRVPYAGYIYPDKQGGCSAAIRKYDFAFNRGTPATSFEQWDTTAFKEKVKERGFLGIPVRRMGTPHWYGHCNGWTAAAIRHAEPQQNVYRNGVVFTPADIKSLLAEIYLYNDTADLAGPDRAVHPAVLHAVLTNWIGRGGHPVAMESDPGEEKWNYPIYGYSSASAKRSPYSVEVKVNIAYQKDLRGEQQEAPDNQRIKYFHYSLNLDRQGNIIGGQYYGDSSNIDMLWVPLQPKLSRQPGNERGNPHIDVNRVVSIWRDSVAAEDRKKWLVADPHPADRVMEVAETKHLVPLQGPNAPRVVPPAPQVEVAESEAATPDITRSEEAASPEPDTAETAPSETITTAETAPSETTAPETTSADSESPPSPRIPGDESEADDDEYADVDGSDEEEEPSSTRIGRRGRRRR